MGASGAQTSPTGQIAYQTGAEESYEDSAMCHRCLGHNEREGTACQGSSGFRAVCIQGIVTYLVRGSRFSVAVVGLDPGLPPEQRPATHGLRGRVLCLPSRLPRQRRYRRLPALGGADSAVAQWRDRATCCRRQAGHSDVHARLWKVCPSWLARFPGTSPGLALVVSDALRGLRRAAEGALLGLCGRRAECTSYATCPSVVPKDAQGMVLVAVLLSEMEMASCRTPSVDPVECETSHLGALNLHRTARCPPGNPC